MGKKKCIGSLSLLVDLHPSSIWHNVLFVFAVLMISDLSFQGHRPQASNSSCFCPSLYCILLKSLVGAAVGQTYTLTSCTLLSNTVIALKIITIFLLFPFNRIPSNEIWASMISPTRIAFGLIS